MVKKRIRKGVLGTFAERLSDAIKFVWDTPKLLIIIDVCFSSYLNRVVVYLSRKVEFIMGNVKASRWIDCHEYFSKEYGPEGIAKIMAALEVGDRTLFEGDILPIKWIDYGAYLRYMFTADKVLGKGDNGLVSAASRYTARKHFTGIYKIFIS